MRPRDWIVAQCAHLADFVSIVPQMCTLSRYCLDCGTTAGKEWHNSITGQFDVVVLAKKKLLDLSAFTIMVGFWQRHWKEMESGTSASGK